MREKKYANILDDFEQEIVEDLNTEIEVLDEDVVEEKLSLTRELKFKELQEAIDFEEQEIEVEEAEDLSTTEEIVVPSRSTKNANVSNDNQDVSNTEKKSNETIEKDIDVVDDELFESKKSKKAKKKEAFNEDLYLTSSFKPFKKRFKFRKVFKLLFKLLLVSSLIIVLTYFVIIPLYDKYQASKPKAIFDASLDYIGEQVVNISDLMYVDSDVFDVEYVFDIDSNIEGIETLSDNKFGFRMGIDYLNKIYETSMFVQGNDEKYGYKVIEKDNDIFYKFTTGDIYLKDKKEKNSLFDYSTLEESLNSSTSHEDLNYYIEKNIDILKSIITEDSLKSEKDEIEVHGKKVNAIRNSLELDSKKLIELEKKYNEKVLDDDRLLEISAELYGLSVTEVREYYNEVEDYEEDYTLVINIYSVKGNQVVGFDIEENGFRNIYYYFNEGNFDVHFNLTDDEDCLEGRDCLLENEFIIDLVGTKKEGYTEVEINLNDEEIGTLDIRSFNYELIDFSYKLIVSDVVLEGVVKIEINKDKEEYGVDFSLEFNDMFIDFDIDFKIYIDSIIGLIEEEKVIEYTDDLFEEEFKVLEEKIADEEALEIFSILLSVLTNPDQIMDTDNLLQSETFETA